MLLFSAAIIWICMVKSDLPTRLAISLALGLVAIILLVVPRVLGPMSSPFDDSLWIRNKEAVIAIFRTFFELIYYRPPKSNKWRPRGLLLSQRTNNNLGV